MSDINQVVQAFYVNQPPSTVSLAATTTSANVALALPINSIGVSNQTTQVQIYNSGTVAIFVRFAPTSAAAVAIVPNGATPGDYPVAPGGVVVCTVPGNTAFAAAITSTSTATVYFSTGAGV